MIFACKRCEMQEESEAIPLDLCLNCGYWDYKQVSGRVPANSFDGKVKSVVTRYEQLHDKYASGEISQTKMLNRLNADLHQLEILAKNVRRTLLRQVYLEYASKYRIDIGMIVRKRLK